jgi:hypothetical protein
VLVVNCSYFDTLKRCITCLASRGQVQGAKWWAERERKKLWPILNNWPGIPTDVERSRPGILHNRSPGRDPNRTLLKYMREKNVGQHCAFYVQQWDWLLIHIWCRG